jgi:hypothetical protein
MIKVNSEEIKDEEKAMKFPTKRRKEKNEGKK